MIYFRWFTVLTKGTALVSEHNIYFSVHRNTLSILMPYKKLFKPESTMVSTKSLADAGSSSEKGQSKEKKEEFEFFFGSNFVFSQFHTARFKVDGITYNCMEQYMHHQKALTFKDNVRGMEILTTKDPKLQKKLGRQVTPFDKAVWGRKCVAVVKKGSLAKYRQNPEMKKVLFASYPKTLVEASPRDRLWGIGLGRNNIKAQNRATWRGKNLLGDTLTEVRNKLMSEEGLITGLESSVSPTNDKSLSGPSTEHHSLTVDQSKLDVMFDSKTETKAQIKTLPELDERSSPSNVDYAQSSLKKDSTPSKKKSSLTTKRKDKSDSNETPAEEIKSSQANTSKESAGEEIRLKDNYSDNKKRKRKLDEETPVKESVPKDESSSAKKRKARSGEQDKHELSKDKEEHSLSKERKERSEEQTTTLKEKGELSLAKETNERSGEENTQTKGKGEQSPSKESKKRSGEHKTPSKAKGKHSSSKEREDTSREHKSLSKDKREHSSSSKERKERSREHNTPSKGKGEHSSSKGREERSEERKTTSKEKREHSSSKEKTTSKDNGKDSSSKKRKERSEEEMTPLKDKGERSSSEARKEKSGELKTPSKDKREHSSSKKKTVSEEEKTPLRDKGEHGSSNNRKERSEKQPTPDRDGVKRLSLEMSDRNETPSKAEHLSSDLKNSLEENPSKTEQHKLPNVPFEFEKLQTDQEYPSASEEKKEIVDNKETLSTDEFGACVLETNDCSMSSSGHALSEDKYLLSSEKIEDSSDYKETSMTEESDVCKTNVTADTQTVREHALFSRKRPWLQDEDEKLSNDKSQQSVKKRKVSTEDSSSSMKQTKITHFTIPDKN